MEAAKIYIHLEPINTLIPWLQDQLPYSGPLLRRIQSSHFLFNPPIGYCLTTFPPNRDGPPTDAPWMAAWINIYSWPETQVWVFSSLEPEASISPSSSLSEFNADTQSIETARVQFHKLVSYIRNELVPPYLATLKPGSLKPEINELTSDGTPKNNAHAPTSLLIGSTHSALFALLQETPPSFPPMHATATDGPHCLKYLFRSPSYKAQGKPNEVTLPTGYRFHDRAGREGVKFEHLDIVLSRTYIRRTKPGLNRMTSAALYFDPQREGESAQLERTNNGEAEDSPIGWVFLAYDGSIAVLHVEPEHRGRGLAVALAREIIKRAMDKNTKFALDLGGHTSEKEEGWVFADVVETNAASHRVMEKLDGEVRWTHCWVIAEVCVPEECAYCARNS